MNFGFNIIKNKTTSLGLAKSHESCEGGAGNTKYFKRGCDEEEEEEIEEENFDETVFDGVDDTEFLVENDSNLAKKFRLILKKFFGLK